MAATDKRQTIDRRRVERRAPKRGVNVRHDDEAPDGVKRVRRGKSYELVWVDELSANPIGSDDGD